MRSTGWYGSNTRPSSIADDVDRLALEERGNLLDSREDAPLPILRKGLQIDLGLDALPVIPMGQDLDRAREVDVGDFAALDVGVGSGVKRALRGVRHIVCDPRVTTKVAKSVSEAWGQVKLATPEVGVGGGGRVLGPRGTLALRPAVAGLHPGARLARGPWRERLPRPLPPPPPPPYLRSVGGLYMAAQSLEQAAKPRMWAEAVDCDD